MIFLKRLNKLPPVFWMLLVIIVIFSRFSPNYMRWGNIVNVLIQSSPLLILAMGQTLVILTEGIDMSLGAQVSMATVLWIWCASMGIPLYIAAVLTVAATVLAGFINGLLVGKFHVPAFIVTLAMMNIMNSISLQITRGASIYYYDPIFSTIASDSLLFIPIPLLFVLFAFLLSWVLLHHTSFGVEIRGLGGNAEALTFAGVSPTWALIKVYMYAGFIAGICGLLTTCRVESGQPTVATGWEFQAVAATLLGGTSFYEGRGDVTGTLLGVLLIKVLQNGLNICGVSAMYHNAIIGLVVLFAIVIDALLQREQNRNQEIR